MSKKIRVCIIWNHPETPKSDIIDIDALKNPTEEVIAFLKENWHFGDADCEKHFDQIQLVPVPVPENAISIDPTVIAYALYFSRIAGTWEYTKLIKIKDGESVLQALRRQTNIREQVTFEIPEGLVTKLNDWYGVPILRTCINAGDIPGIHTEVIGFLRFIDFRLAMSITTLQLNEGLDDIDPAEYGLHDFEVALVSLKDLLSRYLENLSHDYMVDEPTALLE